MALQLKFGDLVLEGVVDWGDSLPSKVEIEEFPRRHGGIVADIAFNAPRIVTLSGEIVKNTAAELKTALDDLGQRLSELGRDKLRLYDDDNRFLYAIKKNYSKGRNALRAPALASKFDIEFFCDDPFWYSTIEQASAQQSPVASPHTFAVTNSGGAETPPRIEIKANGASATAVKVTNVTIGLFTQFTGTVLDGNLLVIDMDLLSVKNGGADGRNSLASGSTFWPLVRGVNNLEYVGPVAVLIKTAWTERWAT